MSIRKELGFEVIVIFLIAAVLYFSSLYNYLLFHSIAEIFSIVIGFSLFIISWHSKKYSNQRFDYLIFIGITYFFVSALDLFHTLSYKGMSIFNDYDYCASQFWIGARYLESISLVIPFLFMQYKRKLNTYFTFLVYALITTSLIASIFYFKVFPICFIEGKGQTNFKIISEYIICFILFITVVLLKKNRQIFNHRVYKYLLLSVVATMFSEFSFPLYVNVYDFSNLTGHYFKVLSFYFIYKAIIVTSITEPYERSCNELEERQKAILKYKYLFNSIDEGFCIIDIIYNSLGEPIDYGFVEVNPAFEQLTGLQNSEGKKIRELLPDFNDEILNILSKVALDGEPIRFHKESKALQRWYSLYAFKIDQTAVSQVAVLISDITEDVNAKNEMASSIKMQDEIFTNISHELKTPLNVIFSTIQLLEIYSNGESLDAVKNKVSRSIRIIKQNCYRFTKLINNIVDLSKIDSGFMKLNLRNEDIVEVVENIVQSISDFIHEKDLNIVFSTNIKKKVIAVDPDKIERVLLNLISNAIKFSNRHGTISVSVMARNDMIEVSVKDTGVGIDRQYLDVIFERFYQVNKTLNRNAEGTGIGLSLVKLIIEMHGGEVNIESKPGNGSIFKVSLPAKKIKCSKSNRHHKLKSNKVEMITIEFSDIYNL